VPMPTVTETRTRSRSLPTVLVALMAFTTAAEVGAEWPSWIESWLFNPKERTARGIELMDRGESPEAVAPLNSALRLTEGRPDAQYNAGTARLEAEAGNAVRLLEAAAAGATEELQVEAHYNLGNARMVAHDLEGAIEAYQQALRLDPSFQDAKFNLELARQRLQQGPQQQQQEQSEDDSQNDQDQEGQDQEGRPDSEEGDPSDPKQEQQEPGEGDAKPQQPQDSSFSDEPSENRSEGDPQTSETPSPGEAPTEPKASRESQQNSPLPQFRDLPDMTAEEAAAILEAIENLEREQRRQQALAAAKRTSRGGKDW